MRRWRCAGGRSTRGASGVDMGRNIFQSSAPRAMLEGGEKVVHENLNAREAYQFWQEEKQGELEMNVTLVEINIKPERVDEFLEVFRANHEGRCGSQATCALMSCRIPR